MDGGEKMLPLIDKFTCDQSDIEKETDFRGCYGIYQFHIQDKPYWKMCL